MPEEKEKGAGFLSVFDIPTALEQLPPTDPEIIHKFDAQRTANIHYSAIGRVAAAFARFESTVDYWLWEFSGVGSSVGVCFTGQMIGPRPRVDAFIALVKFFGAKRKWNTKFDELSKDATALGEQRNRAVHDVWDMTIPDKPQRIEATAKKSVRYLMVHVPTEELLTLEVHIIDLNSRFDDVAMQLADELLPSAETTL
jgi:hypothetical protein